MKTKLVYIVIVLFLLSCSRATHTVDFSNVVETEDKIVDLSKTVKVDSETSEPIIIDNDYFDEMTEYLVNSKRNCELLISAKHQDRLYLGNLQYSVDKLKSILNDKGVELNRIEAKIGFDFKTRFSEQFEKSSIVAIIK